MSTFGGIDLAIMAAVILIQSINEIRELKRLGGTAIEDITLADSNKKVNMVNAEGKTEEVDILVSASNGNRIGFQKQKNGIYRTVTSPVNTVQQKQQQQSLLNKIKQRYSYNVLKQELAKKGFAVVEEKNLENNMVKIVVRRWK